MDREKETKFYLDALQVPSKPLTSWEEDFLLSVTEQFEARPWSITDRQFRKLEDIYNEKG